MICNGSLQSPNQMFSCLDVSVWINNKFSSPNFIFNKTQFYHRIYPDTSNKQKIETSQCSLKHFKHRYEKFSTPLSCSNLRRFEQKGIIVVWPQRKKVRNTESLTLFTWLLAQTLYFLYVTNILPSGNVIALRKPPWNFKRKLRRPWRQNQENYIIEPDWDTLTNQ
ncbi:hypothetical protein ABEB36_013435 [Hypothenemus hampei]|uniref:Uncharacterized protein n=1 Tax=Hypothenemus hampei TaxID=57062 RepID=A0ABD1E8X6_HYPHA